MGAGLKKEDEDPLKQNIMGTFVASLFVIMGLFLIFVGWGYKDDCTMESIDHYAKLEGRLSNLPKWFIYGGISFLLLGGFVCLTFGAFPLWLRVKKGNFGRIMANILAGHCGRMVVFFTYFVVLGINIVGCLWVYFASLARNERNTYKGGPEYCNPFVWATAHAITKGFWVVSVFGGITLSSKVYAYFARDSPYYGKRIRTDGVRV